MCAVYKRIISLRTLRTKNENIWHSYENTWKQMPVGDIIFRDAALANSRSLRVTCWEQKKNPWIQYFDQGLNTLHWCWFPGRSKARRCVPKALRIVVCHKCKKCNYSWSLRVTCWIQKRQMNSILCQFVQGLKTLHWCWVPGHPKARRYEPKPCEPLSTNNVNTICTYSRSLRVTCRGQKRQMPSTQYYVHSLWDW
jgi:hypothetical protein